MNAILMSFTIYPTDFEKLLQQLKEYLSRFAIVFKPILTDFGLNAAQLHYCLDSELDHEAILLLSTLAFKINILVVNSLGKVKIYSPQSLDRFYLLLYQDDHYRYHAIKHQDINYSNDLDSKLSCLLRSLNLFSPTHPLIVTLLRK